MKLGHDRIVAITGWNCSGIRLMLTRPDLTTIFEDLRHLIDALDSSRDNKPSINSGGTSA